MTTTVALLALWAALHVARELPVGRSLHKAMVAAPAALLNRLTTGHVLFAILLIAIAGMVVWAGEADGLRVLTMAAPDVAAWFTTFEVSAYLDILATIAAASAALRLGRARDVIVMRIAAVIRRDAGRTRPRCSRTRATMIPANDDEDGASDGAYALAS